VKKVSCWIVDDEWGNNGVYGAFFGFWESEHHNVVVGTSLGQFYNGKTWGCPDGVVTVVFVCLDGNKCG